MSILPRREFLTATAALFGGAALGIEPFERKKAELKLGLAAISYHKRLDLAKPTMTLIEFIDLAATLPVDTVELTSYYWAETTDEYAKKLLAHAKKMKLPISGVPVRNEFTLLDDAKRKVEIDHVKKWIGLAATAEAKTVRIFAGAVPKGDTRDAARKRVVEAIEECCTVAEKAGVLLALENHGGLTETADDILAIAKAVKSKAFGLNVDTGNFKTKDPYADIAKIVPYGVVCQVKTECFPAGKPSEEADLKKVVQILKDGHFQGAVVLEYEAKEDSRTAVPKYVKELRTLIG
jgi:sugar phosphate isomerase/epimerase